MEARPHIEEIEQHAQRIVKNAENAESQTTSKQYIEVQPHPNCQTIDEEIPRGRTTKDSGILAKAVAVSDEHDVHNVQRDNRKHPFFEVKVGDTWLKIMADSGSSINILDECDFNKLKTQPTLESTNVRVYPYKSTTCLPVKGKFKSTIKTATATAPGIRPCM